MKTETKKDVVAFARMIAGIVLMFAWWIAVLCICANMDCACWLPVEIGNIPIGVFGAMIAIPGSYLIARIGGRMQAVWGLVAACLLWPLWFLDCFMWVLGDGRNVCYGEYFRVGISILFGIEVLAAFYFAWRKFLALRQGNYESHRL